METLCGRRCTWFCTKCIMGYLSGSLCCVGRRFIFFTIFTLPFGLLAGFIGHLVSKQPPKALRDVVISFLLGILFLLAGLFLLSKIIY